MIDFPTSPVVGDTYTYNTRTWRWNGDGWERQLNSGQVVAVFVSPGVEVLESANVQAAIGATWVTLNYV